MTEQLVMQNKARSESRIEWLDALRGIASVIVMCLHYYHRILLGLIPVITGGSVALQSVLEKKVLSHTVAFYQTTDFYQIISTITPFIYGYWDLGKIGVVAFFFISGYVIAYSIGRLKEQPVQTFLLSRFFRLYPIFWVTLCLMIALRLLHGHTYSLWQIFMNFTMFNKFFLVPDINGVAWTLQIELTFYLLVILFFVLGLSKKVSSVVITIYAFLGLALLMAVGKALTGKDLPLALPLGLSVMFTGWTWRMSHESPQSISQKQIVLLVGSFIPLWWIIFQLGYAEHPLIYFNSYVLAAISVIVFAFFNIRHPILRFFGNISYSLYLVHDVIGLFVFPWLMSLALPAYKANFALTALPFLATTSLTIAIATLLYYFVEKPSIAWGKNVIKRRSLQNAAQTPQLQT